MHQISQSSYDFWTVKDRAPKGCDFTQYLTETISDYQTVTKFRYSNISRAH